MGRSVVGKRMSDGMLATNREGFKADVNVVISNTPGRY